MNPYHTMLSFCQDYPQLNGVCLLTKAATDFEAFYIEIREKEGRILPDEAVRHLPVSPSPEQRQEWQYRQFTAALFMDYLQKQDRGTILDLGCGNGWFTQKLTLNHQNAVLGLDVNMTELQQAARLFGNDDCRLAYGDIFEAALPNATFRYIVINSAAQYFPDLAVLIQRLMTLLMPHGEIHILDTPFYPVDQLAAAAERTNAYYKKSGTPEMSAFYHHHSLNDLKNFHWKLMYDPNHWWNALKRKAGYANAIFPWIRIQATL